MTKSEFRNWPSEAAFRHSLFGFPSSFVIRHSSFSFGHPSLTHPPPSIHRQHLAGREFGSIAQEINRGGIQIGRLANAPAVQRLFRLNEIQNRRVVRGDRKSV